MNSYYGILGEKNSVFYNPFVQNSITMTGQDLITTSIIGMENFLSNNVLFNDTNDAITFIENVKDEKLENEILSILDEPRSKKEVITYLCDHHKEGVVIDRSIIEGYINGLDIELVNRIFYKNQIIELIEGSSLIKSQLKSVLEYEFTDGPAPEVKDVFELLKGEILDFCYYDYLIEDRYKRSMKDTRHSIITIDTDSNFINANKYVEFITDLFNLDKSNKEEQGSIVNIIINITTEALRRIFWTLTTNMGLVERAKPIINMKQEFLYKRILLTNNKKNYAGIITAELGNLLDKPSLDVKGMPALKKTSTPKLLRKRFTEIVTNDILKAETISVKKVIDEFDKLEDEIMDSLSSGKVEYLLPKNVETIDTYKTPDTIEQIRAVLTWNALEPESVIVPPEKINMIKLNCPDINDPRLLKLKEDYPEKYNAIMKTVFNYNVDPKDVKIDISRFGFSCVAIPKGLEKIPEYLMPFIDYRSMVNNNMSPGFVILESLGIQCEEVKTVKYKSNIIKI